MFRQTPQDNIIEKYNPFVEAFNSINESKLLLLSENGVCGGLVNMYCFYAAQGRQKEFYSYLQVISAVNPRTIKDFVKKIQTSRAADKDPILKYRFNNRAVTVSLRKLIDFFYSVQSAQKDQNIHQIGGTWEKTFTIFCQTSELADYLKLAEIKDGALIRGWLGKHAFGIERVKEGFYLFEPNNILFEPVLYQSEVELAAAILANSRKMLNQESGQILLALRYINFTEQHREVDEACHEFLLSKESRQYPRFVRLIKDYREGDVSVADLALQLADKIAAEGLAALQNLYERINAYIVDNNLRQEQEIMFDMVDKYKDDVNALPLLNEYTWLSFAAVTRQFGLCEKLLVAGANPDLGASPAIFWASNYGDIGFLELLLKHHANVNLVNKNGCTPLHFVAAVGSVEMVKKLLEAIAGINEIDNHGSTPLHAAILANNVKAAQLLIDVGTNVNTVGHLKSWTPLHSASLRDMPTIVKSLLAAGANIHAVTDEQFTPLHCAAEKNQAEIVGILLDAGADIHAAFPANLTSTLKFISQTGHPQFAKMIKDKKNFDQSLLQFTALHRVLIYGKTETVQLLLERGATLPATLLGIDTIKFVHEMGYTDIEDSLIQFSKKDRFGLFSPKQEIVAPKTDSRPEKKKGW